VNTGELEAATAVAARRVLEIQAKLHRWARDDPHRRFDDLFNLVADPVFLLMAWDRVRHNKGAKTAGVDGHSAYYVQAVVGVEEFLDRLRGSLKDRSFRPGPVREHMIPKAGGKQRRLGIATITDRVVQASLTLVLEPILEADFLPCSYGFRPGRRAHDAIAEARYLAARSYEWIVEGDITACFDEISHPVLMDRLRRRIADKRVLALVKAFLKAGILGQDGALRDSNTGVPQGGILSPVLANLALSVLDESIAQIPGGPGSTQGQRAVRRHRGQGNYRLVRYADDWLLMVSGTREHAEQMREHAAAVLAPMGLRLSAEKTKITHIDEGLDFLGWRIQRHPQARHQPVLRLHLPVPQGRHGRDGQGEDHLPAQRQPAAPDPHPPAQPGATRLVRLLPARRVRCHLLRPSPLHPGPVLAMGTAQTPPDHREGHPPPLLRRRMVAGHHRDCSVQPGHDAHHALSLPGSSNSGTMASPRMTHHGNPNGTSGEPGAGTTGTPGSGGGSGKPTSRNTGRAPRVDLTRRSAWSWRG
jgi:RNA-directed DNA polymerase